MSTKPQYEEAKIAVCAILTELAATPEGWLPPGHIYTALQSIDTEVYTLDAYFRLLALMDDWIEVEGSEIVRITPAGRAVAAKIESALAKRGQHETDHSTE
jgi:hypothetical protein